MQEILAAQGRDSQMFIDASEFPLPQEYQGSSSRAWSARRPTTSRSGRSCSSTAGTSSATRPRRSARPGAHIINIDHHHDNTRFGTVNYVVPEASCTAEIVWDLMHGLGVEPTLNIAEALYVGLITDTGRFMYENTGPRAHEMAADLIEHGVDVHEIYRRVYEGVPYGKLALLARGLAKVHRYDGGRLTVTELDADDFAASDAEESYSEGVIDHLRAVEGTAVAALIRERTGEHGRPRRARCRCARATNASTCRRSRAPRAAAAIARPPASRPSMELGRAGRVPAQEVAAAAREVSADAVSDGVVLYDKPAGITSHDVVARMRRARDRPRQVKVGHAGTLDPFATGLLLVLVGRATRVQRFLMALPKRYEATARFGAVSTTGDPEGEIDRHRGRPRRRSRASDGRIRQRPPAFSAVKVGGRRAYALARAGETVELDEREVEVYRFDEVWRSGARRGFVIECSSGTYVRSLIADLGDAYCEELRRTAIGQFDVADADPERIIGLYDALAFIPEVRLDAEQARRAAHGVAVPERPAAPRWSGSPTRRADRAGDAARRRAARACRRPPGLITSLRRR